MFIYWAGHVARMEEGRSTFTILTGNKLKINLWLTAPRGATPVN